MLSGLFISFLVAAVLFSTTISAAASNDCSPQGPAFPAPRGLASSSTWQTALEDFRGRLDEALSSPESPLDKNATSFSLNVFSAHSKDVLFEYHYEARDMNGSIPEGKTLNGDTVYRIASVSKLITVYTFLLEAGFGYWDEPVAKYVPEIAEAIESAGGSGDDTVVHQWADVTLGSLASHMSGVGRGDLADLLTAIGQNQSVELGFPPVDQSEVLPCGLDLFGDIPQCTREQLFKKILDRPPGFAPFRTPSYSNTGYILLSLALRNIKDNATIEDMAFRSISEPLDLTWTTLEKPDDSMGIIPPPPLNISWDVSLEFQGPSGGFYSTANDMASIGQSILGSTLLPSSSVSRWLKPVIHTGSLSSAVGHVWEIYRLTKPRVIDLYAKNGGLGDYGSEIILSPDHDVGFAILTSGKATGLQTHLLSDMVSGILVPALEQEARQEAITRFGGRYVNSGNGGGNGTSSEIIISSEDDGGPGLKVDKWVLNGVSIEVPWATTVGLDPELADLSIRLYPAGLASEDKVVFRAVIQQKQPDSSQSSPQQGQDEYESVFSTCGVWSGFDLISYANKAADDFVFELDGDIGSGQAVSLVMRTWQMTLTRENV